ncbi:hypothetical protein KIPB_006140 [Kipferlia bialata]|uniref:Uncharacterized protein n=1 Tax=Kipferlia bialata TaxID=797122 RepID=A0A9K3CZ01_9EUKA|nr:hypothetical protein KIPB_006140 [Kipferlia bialata]|eukprot:g6140.t1
MRLRSVGAYHRNFATGRDRVERAKTGRTPSLRVSSLAQGDTSQNRPDIDVGLFEYQLLRLDKDMHKWCEDTFSRQAPADSDVIPITHYTKNYKPGKLMGVYRVTEQSIFLSGTVSMERVIVPGMDGVQWRLAGEFTLIEPGTIVTMPFKTDRERLSDPELMGRIYWEELQQLAPAVARHLHEAVKPNINSGQRVSLDVNIVDGVVFAHKSGEAPSLSARERRERLLTRHILLSEATWKATHIQCDPGLQRDLAEVQSGYDSVVSRTRQQVKNQPQFSEVVCRTPRDERCSTARVSKVPPLVRPVDDDTISDDDLRKEIKRLEAQRDRRLKRLRQDRIYMHMVGIAYARAAENTTDPEAKQLMQDMLALYGRKVAEITKETLVSDSIYA